MEIDEWYHICGGYKGQVHVVGRTKLVYLYDDTNIYNPSLILTSKYETEEVVKFLQSVIDDWGKEGE